MEQHIAAFTAGGEKSGEQNKENNDPLTNPLTQRKIKWNASPIPEKGGGIEAEPVRKKFVKHLCYKIAMNSNDDEYEGSDLELNSHADSLVVGKHAYITE